MYILGINAYHADSSACIVHNGKLIFAIEEERLKIKRDSYEEGTQSFIDANNELEDYRQANAQQQKKLEKELNLSKEDQLKQTIGNIAKGEAQINLIKSVNRLCRYKSLPDVIDLKNRIADQLIKENNYCF